MPATGLQGCEPRGLAGLSASNWKTPGCRGLDTGQSRCPRPAAGKIQISCIYFNSGLQTSSATEEKGD